MKKILLSLTAALLSLTAVADDFDTNKPFGFCTRSSRTDATAYNITGGGCYTYPIPDGFTGRVITLTSDGQDVDMKAKIQNGIKNSEVLILDGSNGPFYVSQNVGNVFSNRTIIGINNARICTIWHMTDEIKAALDAAGVPSMSTSSGTGGKLPNGKSADEEAEYNTRKIIIELTDDNSESYKNSGILTLQNCENIIIRNITFEGPGSVDAGGADLLSITKAKNIWIDHCVFQDGMDGNFDITNSSDFITVSWCTFSYTDRSYMHQNTNLIGSSDSEATGYLNTTFAFNWWGEGCKQRMPMARVGKIHMLNNYFSSTTASNCINPRKNSEFLIEGNYFETGVKKYYGQSGATAVTWKSDNFAAETNTVNGFSGKPNTFQQIGSTVTVPYTYTVTAAANVPETVKAGAGATLKYGSSSGITTAIVNTPSSNISYNLRGQRVDSSYKGIVIKNGKKYIQK